MLKFGIITTQEKRYHSRIFGWYGVIIILSAYALLNFRLVDSDNLIDQILVGTGTGVS